MSESLTIHFSYCCFSNQSTYHIVWALALVCSGTHTHTHSRQVTVGLSAWVCSKSLLCEYRESEISTSLWKELRVVLKVLAGLWLRTHSYVVLSTHKGLMLTPLTLFIPRTQYSELLGERGDRDTHTGGFHSLPG